VAAYGPIEQLSGISIRKSGLGTMLPKKKKESMRLRQQLFYAPEKLDLDRLDGLGHGNGAAGALIACQIAQNMLKGFARSI